MPRLTRWMVIPGEGRAALVNKGVGER